jgi:hypothetical protein
MDFESRAVGRAQVRSDRVVRLNHEKLKEADFSGRELTQFGSIGSTLERCRFDGVRIEGGAFGAGRSTSQYIDCTFDGADIHFGAGGFARFVRCSFRDATVREWYCFTVELVECTFTGLLSHVIFNGAVPQDKRRVVRRKLNEFRGNDFSGAELINVAFRTGIDLDGQDLPSGSDYLYIADADAALQWARSEVAQWRDERLRRGAHGFLGTLLDELVGGQTQLLLRRSDFVGVLDQTVVESVFGLLEGYVAAS